MLKITSYSANNLLSRIYKQQAPIPQGQESSVKVTDLAAPTSPGAAHQGYFAGTRKPC